MNAESRLHLIRVKVERAKKHLLEFDVLANSFEGVTHQIVVSDQDFSGGRIQMSASPPDVREYPVASFELLAVAGDIVQNLRSSLDHLAYQLALVGTPGTTPSDWVAFPIVRDPKDYESAKVRKVQGMRPTAVKAIDHLKPYKGGNDSLWRLHELNNIDKHRFNFTVFRNGLFIGDGFEGHYWLQAKDVLFNGITPPKMNEKVDFSSAEALSQAEISKSQPLFPFLHQVVGFIDALVGDFLPHLA